MSEHPTEGAGRPDELAAGEKIPLESFPPYLMNRLMARLNQNLAERLRKVGLNFQYWRVLLVLAMHGPRNFSALIEETIVHQSTLSRVVARMEQAGLVARETDKNDSRIVYIRLTPAGQAKFDEAYPLAMAEHRRGVAHLSPEEEALITRLLQRMVADVCDE
jgi:DNA-binding MarR family transcriptional regulator